MKTLHLFVFAALVLLASGCTKKLSSVSHQHPSEVMKTYVIEREMLGAGNLTSAELKGVSQQSCDVLKEMSGNIVWLQSYVTDDKVYCIYQADNEKLLYEHAEKGGFPITSVSILSTTISPETAK